MKICVCGPESSGTRMATALIAKCPGVEAYHSSPAFRKMVMGKDGPYKYWAECDKAVLVIRNGSWNAKSMVNRERLAGDDAPFTQITNDVLEVLWDFRRVKVPVFIVTYESLVYETEHTIKALCADLDIPEPTGYDEIKNGNEKFWSADGWAGDNRELTER